MRAAWWRHSGLFPSGCGGLQHADVHTFIREGVSLRAIARRLGPVCGTARLAYTTVVTGLIRMHDKGLLTRATRGRAFAHITLTDDSGLPPGSTAVLGILGDHRPDPHPAAARPRAAEGPRHGDVQPYPCHRSETSHPVIPRSRQSP
ncbi:BlaI/MecI/CopY family transcriptional regulator [Kitasatospora cathayae]|uniref:BlaI/MecI/CopY family transcriptional regulator n=1 Tax=Kitasatospora cathayae TaxID=3004092 RepID=A0ABY7PY50_9ACTN|nr:BlaI/MecI/CopY family transcriptional regulator [Kitasatospora sp. HUAS 3-15]WBP85102.1 BlaI/MecI/CopY family transcriptional regulator [Kitasatospora sp. HUAS 3-15]